MFTNYKSAIDNWEMVLKIDPDHQLSKKKIQKANLAMKSKVAIKK